MNILITNVETLKNIEYLSTHPFVSHMSKEELVARAVEKYANRKREELNHKSLMKRRIKNLLSFQDWECAYCHCPLIPKTATIDHMVPLIEGGSMNDISNQVAACGNCNGEKDDLNHEEYQNYLLKKEIWKAKIAGKETEGETLGTLQATHPS